MAMVASVASVGVYRSSSRAADNARRVTIVAAVLLAAAVFLEFAAGEPPTGGDGLLGWIESNQGVLTVLDEVLVFAALALGAAVMLVRRAVGSQLSERLSAAHALVGLTAVMMFVTSLVGGRFVYPIFGMSVDDQDSAELVVGLFFGGQHMVWLLFGAMALAIVGAIRHVSPRWFRWIGVAVALLAMLGSYPDLLGPAATVGVRMVFVAWVATLALLISKQAPTTSAATSGPSADLTISDAVDHGVTHV